MVTFNKLKNTTKGRPSRARGQGESLAPAKLLSVCLFLRKTLEVPFLKEGIKNVYEN